VSGDARRAFLEGIEALEGSLNTALVTGPDAIGEFLRRGLTIVGFNLLEAFISERLTEVCQYMNGGIAHFGDLPPRLQRAATRSILKVASARSQWLPTPADEVSFATDLGHSLVASSGAIRLSPLTFHWPGSNLTESDFQSALRLMHVAQPFATVTTLANRAGFSITDAKAAMVDMGRERNKCAHESGYSVSNLWIRSIPEKLKSLAFGADVALTFSSDRIRVSDATFLSDENWFAPNRVRLRFVEQRSRDWAVIPESRSTALRVAADRQGAMSLALTVALGADEVIVVRDQTRKPLDWLYPPLP